MALCLIELFLDTSFWRPLCKPPIEHVKPISYFTNNFNAVIVPKLKALLSLNLSSGNEQPQLYHMHPGSHGVGPLIWSLGLPALCGSDDAVDKSDKIHKVRPMFDRMLPLFPATRAPANNSASTRA